MYKNRKILAVITARGGSKGLPGKNIKELLGKPLIAWTIEQAKQSKYLDRIIVSTDDEEIALISKQYGADVPFLRPKELAMDTTPSIDVLFHAVDFLKLKGESYDYLALLEPTSPLRKKGDIDNAMVKLIDNEMIADSLVSLGEVHLEHPSILKKINKDGFVIPYERDVLKIQRRQEIQEKIYFPYGVIYFSKINTLITEKTFYQSRTLSYYIERWQNYEIDDIYDFLCIESVMKHKLAEIF